MAILHVIALPQFGDQMFLAGRISHNKFGVHIPSENLSWSSISDAIKEIDSEDYIKKHQAIEDLYTGWWS